MIEIKHITKTFTDMTALDDLTMTVPGGAVYGLVGPNGAGKSTLLRILGGVFRQDAGEALVDGEPVFENPAVKSRIAVIPDDLYFFPQAGIKDMRDFYRGIYPDFDMERYNKLKDIFPLNEKKPIRRMSKGMQKQAAFWLAICMRGDVLLLDEPVDGLDPIMRRQVWGLMLSDVAERNTTVLVSSHNLRELEDVCDHVGILNHGKLLLERSLAELQDGTVKLQIAFDGDMPNIPEEIVVLSDTVMGRVHTLIVRGNTQEITRRLSALAPIFIEAVPLTLEEIFIYELGGEQYAVKDILL